MVKIPRKSVEIVPLRWCCAWDVIRITNCGYLGTVWTVNLWYALQLSNKMSHNRQWVTLWGVLAQWNRWLQCMAEVQKPPLITGIYVLIKSRATHHILSDGQKANYKDFRHYQVTLIFSTLQAPTQQNGQTHSNNLSAVADELFKCLSILWGWRLKS